MATQRRNVSKSKSKSLSKSNKGSSSRKHLIKSRKSGTKTRKMRGGVKGKRWSKVKSTVSGWFGKKTPKPVASPVISKKPVVTATPMSQTSMKTSVESTSVSLSGIPTVDYEKKLRPEDNNNHQKSTYKSKLPETTPRLMLELLESRPLLYKENPSQYKDYLLKLPADLLSPYKQKEKIRFEEMEKYSLGNINADRFR